MFNVVYITDEDVQISSVLSKEKAYSLAIQKILNWGTEENFNWFIPGSKDWKTFLSLVENGDFVKAVVYFNHHSNGGKILIEGISFETEFAAGPQDLKDTAETELYSFDPSLARAR